MMQHCPKCGHSGTYRVPEGDQRKRFICDGCGQITYENPRIVTGCVVVDDGKILLCRRAIEPQRGLWTIPAGFMECGETAEEGARRETREEALAEVEIQRLLSVYSITHISQVQMAFLAHLKSGQVGCGVETLEVKWFAPEAIPWDELAFSAVAFALRHYIAEDSGSEPKTYLGAFRKGESTF